MSQLLCPIAKVALLYPHKIAVEVGERSLSYQMLEQHIQTRQHHLKTYYNRALPIAKLGVIAHPSLETLLIYFAAQRENFSVCLLNPKDPLLQEKIKELSLMLFTPPEYLPAPLSYYNTLITKNHLSTYLYTSGSSSKPKIATLSFQNHYYSAIGMIETLHLTSSSRYLLSLPLYHVSGLSIVFRTFLSGGTLVILSDKESLSLDNLSSLVLTKNISHLSLVSTQYIRLLRGFDEKLLDHLKAVLLGGSFFPQTLLNEGICKKLPLYLSYGLTEMASAVCCNPLLHTKNSASSGFTLPYRKLKVALDGEILVSGKTLFKGYYCPKSKRLVPQKKWFKTNDIGTLSPEGALTLHGRKDRLIISGGENIQPEEVEQALLTIKDIHQAAIIALPDEEFGQQMIAVIDANTTFSLEQLPSLLSSLLPNYKRPKRFLPWPKELKNSSLKTSREDLLHYVTLHQLFKKS